MWNCICFLTLFVVYQPLESILPYDLPKRNVNTIVESAKPVVAAALASPFAKKLAEPALDTYCKACKKKFSNEPTFTNHLKSAKHIANEKKLKPTFKGPASTQKIAVHPKVQEALSMLDQAEKSDNATAALTTYWTQAQTLYVLKRPQYAEKALRMLIDRINTSPTTTFSSAQITSFLYNARLALARLLCIYQQLDDARSIYLDALAGKWKLETPELLEIAGRVRTLSIHDLLGACDQLATKYLTRERNRTKPAPALTDANNSIASILCEAAHLFAQEGQNYQNTLSEHVALVLYATCSLVCPFEPTSGITKDDIYYLMIQVYTSLEDLDYKIVDIYALDTAHVWHMFNALLIAIEIDDLVRAQTIETSLRQSVYPDVQLLCSLYKQKAALSIDNDTLLQQLDFIILLLKQTQDPLVIRNQGQKEQLDIIDRIRNCI